MKTAISVGRLLATIGSIYYFQTSPIRAEDTATAGTAAPALPYGVEDVLKLSRSQVSDDVIVTYVENSGLMYNLTPSEILYVRSQGVSDRVINTMIAQRARVGQSPAAAPIAVADPNATAPQPGAPPPDAAAPAPDAAAPAPPASSTYVIPYPAASSAYYGYSYPYSYYGGYYPYWYGGPVVTFGFGGGYWGRGYGGYHGYYHGGFHGGFHGGGGFHSGGGFHGGHH